ncbi:MAG: sigma-70 family RNA polymerase sigma factor [Bacteroidota bacterium]|nr:sigma-70 family RNA polymerase sigma factor [Bacteroidota bacterium]
MIKQSHIDQLDEQKIIDGAIRKDHACQKWIYEKFANKMMAVCLRYTADADEAKDLLQDSFIRVFDYLHQFGHKGSLEGWVRRVVVTSALNHYNVAKRRFTDVDIDAVDWEKGASYTPYNAQYTMEELTMLIKQLPPMAQTVFNLFAVDGYSHNEIAEMLSISDGTSKSNLFRARALLQEKLKNLEQHSYGQVRQHR